MATTAFCRHLEAIRQNLSRKWQSFLRATPQAVSVSAPFNHRLPGCVLLLLPRPALLLFPGASPAHELRSFSVSNCFVLGPISASNTAAVGSCTPGTVCNSCHAGS